LSNANFLEHNQQNEMEQVWKLYNTLPTLAEADEGFSDREAIFTALGELLREYDNAFGVCLVHAHCTLTEGEIMLCEENVSHPVEVQSAPAHYPERWLSSGQPYEFTTRRTQEPPFELLAKFKALTGGSDFVGLYHADGKPGTRVEWTEGRNNITAEYCEPMEGGSTTETAWLLEHTDEFKPTVKAVCHVRCKVQTTAQGGNHLGKSVANGFGRNLTGIAGTTEHIKYE
jgi:hypothetical protein